MRTKILALLSVLCFSPLIAHADEADAKLKSLNDSNVNGTVHFTEKNDGVKIHYQLNGLNKNETYAVLVREQGNCLKTDVNSVSTSPMVGKNIYTGDLPYLQSDDQGKIDKTVFVKNASVKQEDILSSEAQNPLAHKSLVLAEKTDNTKVTSPGNQLACGVVMPD